MFLKVSRTVNVILGSVVLGELRSMLPMFFVKNDLRCFCLCIVAHPASKIQKNPQRVTHET